MAIAWTRKQEQVITSRNRNLLVSAAAGSGKTAVLVERIVRMIRDFRLESATPVQCVMFIAELKQRIDGDL